MFALPVEEVDTLRTESATRTAVPLLPGKNVASSKKGELLDIDATIEPRKAKKVGMTVRGVAITYDANEKTLTCGKHTAPLGLEKGVLRLRVLADRGSIEVFGNGGRVAIISGELLRPENTGVELFALYGEAAVCQFVVTSLASAWPK
jgi:fructan beta-fructosidase